jgi:hypothetical protein
VTATFGRIAVVSAVLAAVASVVFTGAFAVVAEEGDRWAQWTAWAALLGGGLVALPVMVALRAVLVGGEPQVALVGLLLGVAGALGSSIHAAFELSLLANPVDGPGVPNAVDPRGFMTYGVTGLALLVFGGLLVRDRRLGREPGWLALAGGALFVVVFVSRLTVLDPQTNVIRVAAISSGLAVVPAFYLVLAWALYRREAR